MTEIVATNVVASQPPNADQLQRRLLMANIQIENGMATKSVNLFPCQKGEIDLYVILD